MRTFNKVGLLICIAFAFGMISACAASAAKFTASATGPLSGKALATQVFTINGGEVKCTTAETGGLIAATETTEQQVTVFYKGCTLFGEPVHVSAATFVFDANGHVDITGTITILVTVSLWPDCHVTIPSQTVGTVDFANNGSNLKVTPTVTGIVYQTSALPLNFCGSSGTNGTYKGANEINRFGGGYVSWDS